MSKIIQIFIYIEDKFYAPIFSTLENFDLFEEQDDDVSIYKNHIILNNPQLYGDMRNRSWKITRRNLDLVLANWNLSDEAIRHLTSWSQ
jgi:hypothetical protein